MLELVLILILVGVVLARLFRIQIYIYIYIYIKQIYIYIYIYILSCESVRVSKQNPARRGPRTVVSYFGQSVQVSEYDLWWFFPGWNWGPGVAVSPARTLASQYLRSGVRKLETQQEGGGGLKRGGSQKGGGGGPLPRNQLRTALYPFDFHTT